MLRMAQDEPPKKPDISTGLGSIFERIGEFFHIFDLSFFVSGTLTFGALAFFYVRTNRTLYFPFESWVGIVAFIVGCYVCGLISFAAGRGIAGIIFRTKSLNTLKNAVKEHGIDQNLIESYTKENRLWRLYVRMWSELAHEHLVPVILQHLMRYWAMAATYDGVAFSLMVWCVVLIATTISWFSSNPLSCTDGIMGAIICLVSSIIAFKQGNKYFVYQIEDVVAHFAVKQASLSDNDKSS